MKNFRAYLTELTGTFFLVFVGCGTIAAAQTNAGIGHLGIALAFGVIVTINIYALGHISGCHINPAVTIAFASVRLFPWKNVVPYIIFQIIGAILAAFLGYAIFSDQIFLSVTTPVQGNVLIAVVFEFALTFLLMLTIVSVATDERSSKSFA
jgi:glycerol uptake facilitator-like aquaporin